MIRPFLFVIISLLMSCTNRKQPTNTALSIDTTEIPAGASKNENSKYYITVDTLVIPTEPTGSFKFEKEEFNRIVDEHPEFFDKYPSNPDLAYYCKGNRGEFASEVGQDTYYFLYAHFLKQRNGIEQFSERRKKLIEIYLTLNSIFHRFQYGGTYFAHQYTRVLGYAEYSVYLYSISKDNTEKTYDVKKQKSLYIQSLRQLIKDESQINFNSLGTDKIQRDKELNKSVDELDSMITDIFYLRRTQEFHYHHYEYY